MQKLGTHTKKKKTEEDFKESGVQRVVVATCALGMGINFQNVEYAGLLIGCPYFTKVTNDAI